ncbi:LCP family protein [Robinsoniella sp. KNHs210]|uniref:LCP family protein n=1 Tax=Robinsoniella sp. KNHs210 TaxID=1469950 RepID=UPI0005C7B26E|nr:LCP family protein [Robinsoniella sp. KNHs210]
MDKEKVDKEDPGYKKRKKRKILIIVGVILLLIAAAVAIAYSYVQSKLGKIQSSEMNMDEVVVNEELETNKVIKGYTNIALFGLDTRDEDLSRANSDAIIIASINNDTKEVKLVSIYRDTYLYIGGDLYRKANAAYANGGAERAVSTLNENFDLKIQDYISVDFNALAEIVDLLGGIELTVDEAESVHLNNYCVETSEVTGKSYEKLPGAGTYNMNGVQATSYSRIRYTAGNDFKRTERQREVIEKIVEKVKKADVGTLNKIMDGVFPMIRTSMSQSEMISMGMGMLSYNISETIGFPYDHKTGGKGGSGDDEIPQTLESNVVKLHEFLFGTKDYNPSARVKDLSEKIQKLTGVGPKEESTEKTTEKSSENSSETSSGDTTEDSSEKTTKESVSKGSGKSSIKGTTAETESESESESESETE